MYMSKCCGAIGSVKTRLIFKIYLQGGSLQEQHIIKRFYTPPTFRKNYSLSARINKRLQMSHELILPTNQNAEKINNLCNDVRVHGSILIMGAGASFESGMPLYKQLAPIIWQIVDNFPSIKHSIGVNTDVPAKLAIGDEAEKIIDVLDVIENSSEATTSFKHSFKDLNDRLNTNNLTVHKELCRLIHAGLIKLVISLNWDDLLERAWESLYGTNINSNKPNLIKPNGDVRRLSEKWVFPKSKTDLSDEAIHAFQSVTSQGPTTVIILGYSERDQHIVDELIKPSDRKYVVYRISRSAIGEHGVSLKASEALSQISKLLSPTIKSHWLHVDFSNQVGLEHALMGYRLQSSDVTACPRLPQLEIANFYLTKAHYTIIEGEPGCGKSITAYQLAYDYLINGWEVVKLDANYYNQCDNVELFNDGYKTIYLIDDAQQIGHTALLTLLNKANSRSKIIVAETITNAFPSESVTITRTQAVDTIYKHYAAHKNEIIGIINEQNKNVGRHIGDLVFEVSFEDILKIAAKEMSPWLFNYSLRGGWADTSNKCAEVKEQDRADILLTIIALKQIITLDKPVKSEWLDVAVSCFGYSKQWVSDQLSYLHKKKLIINTREIRTLHLQMAIRVLINYLKNASENELTTLIYLMQKEFLDEESPLLGIDWLFSMLYVYDIKYRFRDRLLTNQFKDNLLTRCASQIDSANRSAAGFVIDRVLHLEGSMSYQSILERSDFLQVWMNTVDNNTAYSYSQILNNMINESRELQYRFVSSLDSDSIIANMKEINPQSLYVWAIFLDRLVIFRNQKWCSEFCFKLPREELHIAMQECSLPNIYALSEMLVTLSRLDAAFAFSEFHKSLPILKRAMEQDFKHVLDQLDIHFLMFLLGQPLVDRRHSTKVQREAGKAFVACITPGMISGHIVNGAPRDWDHFYGFCIEIIRYDRNKYKKAISDIEFNKLNEKTEKLWATQAHELRELLDMLSDGNLQKTENWIFSNKHKIDLCGPTIIELSPRTAKFVYDEGKKIDLISDRRWDISARAIKSLRNYDSNFCALIIGQNIAEIIESFNNIRSIDFENYYLFLHELIQVDSTILDKIINTENFPQFKMTCKKNFISQTSKQLKKEQKGLCKLIELISTYTTNPTINVAILSLKV